MAATAAKPAGWPPRLPLNRLRAASPSGFLTTAKSSDHRRGDRRRASPQARRTAPRRRRVTFAPEQLDPLPCPAPPPSPGAGANLAGFQGDRQFLTSG